jgi:elongation factor 1-alpha
MPKEK